MYSPKDKKISLSEENCILFTNQVICGLFREDQEFAMT